MKIFVLGAAMALSALGACGNAEELKASQAKVETLQKDNLALKGVVTDLNANIGKITAERDELKAQVDKAAAAAAAAPPAPPAKGGAAAKAAPAKPAGKKHK